MASLLRVAELNNSGASMLVAAKDKDAFKTLQTALSIMESEMLLAPDKSESSESTDSTTSSTSSSASGTSDERRRSSASDCARAAAAATTESDSPQRGGDDSNAARFHIDTKCSTEIPELRDERYFIFNQALLVVTRDTVAAGAASQSTASPQAQVQAQSRAQAQAQAQTSQTQATAAVVDAPPRRYSQALVCFYTSVVIYNLALAYHKRGMAGSSSSSSSSAPPANTTNGATSTAGAAPAAPAPTPAPISAKEARMALSQSLRLYEHCLKIVRSIANYSEDCKMLLYAVSCNLAHLYCRKGDRIRAQELLDNLEDAKRLSFQNLF